MVEDVAANPWLRNTAEVLYRVCGGDVECTKREVRKVISEARNAKLAYLYALSKVWAKKIKEHGIRPRR